MHCSFEVGLALAGGTVVPDESKPGAAPGGSAPVGEALGGRVLGGKVLGGNVLGATVLGGNGGKVPCCALSRSDVVAIATTTPVGTSAGNVATTAGQEAA